MKRLGIFLFCLAILLGAGHSMKAQLTQPFLMREGINAALKAASDSGWTERKLVAIVTIGDTAGLGVGQLLTSAFDLNRGTSPVWVYVIAAKDKSGTDILRLLAYIKVPILGLNQFPIPDGVIPSDLPFTPTDSLPISKMLNSDAIAQKLNANTQFKSFRTQYPSIKPSFISSFVLPLPIPGLSFSAGDPIWGFSMDGGDAMPGVGLDCYVHGVSGEVICQAPLSAEQDNAISNSGFSIYPNPAGQTGQIILKVPENQFSAAKQIQIMDALGTTVRTLNVQSHPDHSIIIPIAGLNSGSWFLRYTSQDGKSVVLPFIVQF
jgi:hypothetical protein